MNIPRVVIAGTRSGVGKTTITAGIISACRELGLTVQPFKVGPDYIDPGFHSLAAGRTCRNLDTWLMGDNLLEAFSRGAAGADVAVIEGVMGLYDGAAGAAEAGSTAQLAKMLQAPVLLVVDVASAARSVAAEVLGFCQLDPAVNVAGVLLNRVASERHFRLVNEAIEHYCAVPVIGALSKNQDISLPARHLGLIPTTEHSLLPDKLSRITRAVTAGVDLPAVLALARQAGKLAMAGAAGVLPPVAGEAVKIAVARDEAFHFYYPDNLDLLEQQGARLVFFSPLHDRHLPSDMDGLIIGGGFPEEFLPALAQNQIMIKEVAAYCRQGGPVYAECGGLMYLCREIADTAGQAWPMAGVVPAACLMEQTLVGMGYVEAEACHENLLCRPGEVLRGHEFHYSRLAAEAAPAFYFRSRNGKKPRWDGFARGNLLATYLHLYFTPELADRLITACTEFRRNGRCVPWPAVREPVEN